MSDTSSTLASKTLAQRLYNAYMAETELDLCTYNLAGLDEKYKDETDTERSSRMQRYAEAFAAFDVFMEDLLGAFASEIHQVKKVALKLQEQEDREEEAAEMETLSQAFS